MNKKTRNTVLSAINAWGYADSDMLLQEFNRKNLTTKFDNSVMRFVRRLYENGYLKRAARGYYIPTAKGKRFISKVVYA